MPKYSDLYIQKIAHELSDYLDHYDREKQGDMSQGVKTSLSVLHNVLNDNF
jgi:hypothetical protein